MAASVEILPWQSAPFDLNGETVFAIGDVHGCARHLDALLTTIEGLAREAPAPRRLTYLGDMIDRGPSTIGVLRRWAESAAERGVERVDRIIGNHEIIMLLAMRGGPQAATTTEMWLADRTGGSKVLNEMRAAVADPQAMPTLDLAIAAFGRRVVDRLLAQRPYLRLGNTLFVHGGLDGRLSHDDFLAPAWTEGVAARWAWITEGFLDWTGGFGGTLVVHGHTPPRKHTPLSGMDDTHQFLHDRLCLDGGSALTGIVVAAQITDGRFRLIKATSA